MSDQNNNEECLPNRVENTLPEDKSRKGEQDVQNPSNISRKKITSIGNVSDQYQKQLQEIYSSYNREEKSLKTVEDRVSNINKLSVDIQDQTQHKRKVDNTIEETDSLSKAEERIDNFDENESKIENEIRFDSDQKKNEDGIDIDTLESRLKEELELDSYLGSLIKVESTIETSIAAQSKNEEIIYSDLQAKEKFEEDITPYENQTSKDEISSYSEQEHEYKSEANGYVVGQPNIPTTDDPVTIEPVSDSSKTEEEINPQSDEEKTEVRLANQEVESGKSEEQINPQSNEEKEEIELTPQSNELKHEIVLEGQEVTHTKSEEEIDPRSDEKKEEIELTNQEVESEKGEVELTPESDEEKEEIELTNQEVESEKGEVELTPESDEEKEELNIINDDGTYRERSFNFTNIEKASNENTANGAVSIEELDTEYADSVNVVNAEDHAMSSQKNNNFSYALDDERDLIKLSEVDSEDDTFIIENDSEFIHVNPRSNQESSNIDYSLSDEINSVKTNRGENFVSVEGFDTDAADGDINFDSISLKIGLGVESFFTSKWIRNNNLGALSNEMLNAAEIAPSFDFFGNAINVGLEGATFTYEKDDLFRIDEPIKNIRRRLATITAPRFLYSANLSDSIYSAGATEDRSAGLRAMVDGADLNFVENIGEALQQEFILAGGDIAENIVDSGIEGIGQGLIKPKIGQRIDKAAGHLYQSGLSSSGFQKYRNEIFEALYSSQDAFINLANQTQQDLERRAQSLLEARNRSKGDSAPEITEDDIRTKAKDLKLRYDALNSFAQQKIRDTLGQYISANDPSEYLSFKDDQYKDAYEKSIVEWKLNLDRDKNIVDYEGGELPSGLNWREYKYTQKPTSSTDFEDSSEWNNLGGKLNSKFGIEASKQNYVKYLDNETDLSSQEVLDKMDEAFTPRTLITPTNDGQINQLDDIYTDNKNRKYFINTEYSDALKEFYLKSFSQDSEFTEKVEYATGEERTSLDPHLSVLDEPSSVNRRDNRREFKEILQENTDDVFDYTEGGNVLSNTVETENIQKFTTIISPNREFFYGQNNNVTTREFNTTNYNTQTISEDENIIRDPHFKRAESTAFDVNGALKNRAFNYINENIEETYSWFDPRSFNINVQDEFTGNILLSNDNPNRAHLISSERNNLFATDIRDVDFYNDVFNNEKPDSEFGRIKDAYFNALEEENPNNDDIEDVEKVYSYYSSGSEVNSLLNPEFFAITNESNLSEISNVETKNRNLYYGENLFAFNTLEENSITTTNRESNSTIDMSDPHFIESQVKIIPSRNPKDRMPKLFQDAKIKVKSWAQNNTEITKELDVFQLKNLEVGDTITSNEEDLLHNVTNNEAIISRIGGHRSSKESYLIQNQDVEYNWFQQDYEYNNKSIPSLTEDLQFINENYVINDDIPETNLLDPYQIVHPETRSDATKKQRNGSDIPTDEILTKIKGARRNFYNRKEDTNPKEKAIAAKVAVEISKGFGVREGDNQDVIDVLSDMNPRRHTDEGGDTPRGTGASSDLTIYNTIYRVKTQMGRNAPENPWTHIPYTGTSESRSIDGSEAFHERVLDLGYIAVSKSAYTSPTDPDYYRIPFEFNAEVTGFSRTANWNTLTAFGRSNEFHVWSNTSSRTASFKTTYVVLDGFEYQLRDGTRVANDEGNNNSEMRNDMLGWAQWWTEHRIMHILSQYESLVLPMNAKKGTSPPVITIVKSPDLNRYSYETGYNSEDDSSWHGGVALSRWIVGSYSINPNLDAGYTNNRVPRMYEVELDLREVLNTWSDFQDLEGNFYQTRNLSRWRT